VNDSPRKMQGNRYGKTDAAKHGDRSPETGLSLEGFGPTGSKARKTILRRQKKRFDRYSRGVTRNRMPVRSAPSISRLQNEI